MAGAVKKRRRANADNKSASIVNGGGPAGDVNGGAPAADNKRTPPDVSCAPSRRRGLSESTIQRLLLRGAVLAAALAVYLLNRQRAPQTELATVQEEIRSRSQPVTCSQRYAEETALYAGCTPGRGCGRLVSDRVVTPAEARTLRDIAARAFTLTGGGSGGASILDLHSGALSKGESFVNLYTLPEAGALLTEADLAVYRSVKRRVAELLVQHFGLTPGALLLAKPTFFSRMTSVPARTVHDEYWHVHVDKETYPSFHYTSLVYLNDHGEHFRGGRFVFTDSDANRTVEPKTGRVSAFTAGWENPHRVEPVTEGVRYALTVAFTCDPSQSIADPALQTRPIV